jgi:hypothetical protein
MKRGSSLLTRWSVGALAALGLCLAACAAGSNGPSDDDDSSVDSGTVPSCGDGECNGSEASTWCTADCGTTCGDGVCNGGEAYWSCWDDCGCDHDNQCDVYEGECASNCSDCTNGEQCQ